MKRAWMALALTLVAGSASALDLAGYTLGQPFTLQDRDAIARHGAAGGFCEGPTCAGAAYLGDFDGKLSVTADSTGKIAQILVTVDSTSFRSLADSARAKYGKPTVATARAVQNAFGAVYRDAQAVWHRRDGDVVLWQRCADMAHSCLMVAEPHFVPQSQRRKMAL